jgi:undecaprenyl-diphosphatase
MEFFHALLLGFIEGLTEFIPVSSTAHLIMISDWIGFESKNHVFHVFIQLGAIMAVVVTYRAKLWRLAVDAPFVPAARRTCTNYIIACLPALIVGAVAYHTIKDFLYVPWVIGTALIAGGIVILALEKRLQQNAAKTAEDISWRTALVIGMVQTLALIPGVSRSGATIMGALAMGVSRPAAAEFSFVVAIPLMSAAVAYDVYKNWSFILENGDWPVLITGFIVAFITAIVVLRVAMDLINRYGFTPFAWYRIAAGAVVLMGTYAAF